MQLCKKFDLMIVRVLVYILVVTLVKIHVTQIVHKNALLHVQVHVKEVVKKPVKLDVKATVVQIVEENAWDYALAHVKTHAIKCVEILAEAHVE